MPLELTRGSRPDQAGVLVITTATSHEQPCWYEGLEVEFYNTASVVGLMGPRQSLLPLVCDFVACSAVYVSCLLQAMPPTHAQCAPNDI